MNIASLNSPNAEWNTSRATAMLNITRYRNAQDSPSTTWYATIMREAVTRIIPAEMAIEDIGSCRAPSYVRKPNSEARMLGSKTVSKSVDAGKIEPGTLTPAEKANASVPIVEKIFCLSKTTTTPTAPVAAAKNEYGKRRERS